MTFTVKITHVHAGDTYAEAKQMAYVELDKLTPIIDGVPQFTHKEVVIDNVRTKTHKGAITRIFRFIVPSHA